MLIYLSREKIFSYYFKNKRKRSPIFMSDAENLFQANQYLSFNLGIAFLSLAGIPPLVGFFAKAFVLFNLLNANFFFASVLFLFIAIFSTYYYIRMLKIFLYNFKDSKLFFGPLFNKTSILLDTFSLGFYTFLLFGIFFSPTTVFVLVHYICAFILFSNKKTRY